ncbi:MAG: hypothetical protein KA715_07065 [Xanthomonadaceae bacterium]|nr:hypothetical protein [Xanthomonadaceae bacterium]
MFSLWIFLSLHSARATDQVPVPNSSALLPNIVGETTGSLPQGRFIVSVLNLVTPLESKSLLNGDSQSFSSLFNRNLTWQTLMDSEPARKNQVAGLLSANGIMDFSQSAGSFAGSFGGRATTLVPLIGYGLTDRIGVFFVIPIIKFQTSYSTAYQASSSAQQLIQNLQSSGQSSTASEMAESLNQGFDLQLKHSGFTNTPNRELQCVGDLRMEVPVPLTEVTKPLQWIASTQAVFPTAEPSATDDFFGFSGGEKRFALGQKITAAWNPPGLRRSTILASTSVMIPFGTEMSVRVPKNSIDFLPSDIDPSTQISGGILAQAFTSFRYDWSTLIGTKLSYQFQRRFQKTFSGSLFDSTRYDLLTKLTEESLHSIQAGIEFNTIRAFLDGKFLFPGMLSLGAGIPIASQNSLNTPTYLLQGALFF